MQGVDIKTQERLRVAFLAARYSLLMDGIKITPEEIVFQALRCAMDTLKKTPDPERNWLYSMKSAWPEMGTSTIEQDILRWERGRLALMENIDAGEGISDRTTPSEVESMHAVFDAYPRNLVGTKRRRDWRILCFLAMGMPPRKVCKDAECSVHSVNDRRKVQRAALARAFQSLIRE